MSDNTIRATARILIRRPVEEVFEAFADPDRMTRFWFPESTGRLAEGASVRWHVGTGGGAPWIDVDVLEFRKDAVLKIRWSCGAEATTVAWKFSRQDDGTTFVEIAEEGFDGPVEEAVAKALDSTSGFNQVIVAAKALLEHGVDINVVKDHAPAGV